MHWLYMFCAIAFEITGTISLKLSAGFSKPLFVAVTVTGYGISFLFLGLALKGLPVSTAYAVWAGLGTALIAVIGMTFMSEPVNGLKIASIVFVVLGVVGLHLAERAG